MRVALGLGDGGDGADGGEGGKGGGVNSNLKTT